MICKRCGSACPHRPEGYCFHCKVAIHLDEATGAITDGRIKEGFPDWKKPTKKDSKQQNQDILF